MSKWVLKFGFLTIVINGLGKGARDCVMSMESLYKHSKTKLSECAFAS